jgi:FdrA protein
MTTSLLANTIRRGLYLDSVALMRISAQITALDGIEAAALMIGSRTNKEILAASNLLAPEAESAVANDLIIAIRARSSAHLAAATDQAEQLLLTPSTTVDERALPRVRRFDAALLTLSAANLALISVPGEFAAFEARRALGAGLNVVMFSDNVSLDDEVRLKEEARQRGLLMMGPDCGTCLINGTPIAFANAVPRGTIGIVSASGTGLQEVSTLLARAGHGIAHGIGVGGRDLSSRVGGITTHMAIDALERDPSIDTIMVVSKPPAAAVVDRLLARVAASGKRFVVCFMGREHYDMPANASFANTLRQAVEHCVGPIADRAWVTQRSAGIKQRRGSIRGLFCGGTLCNEAQVVLMERGFSVASNVPIPGAASLPERLAGTHCLIDLGDDDYTRGRPHPMIDPAARSASIADALADPTVAVLLLDLVIGYGAHADPAAVVAESLSQCFDRDAVVIASVTGTEQDPQRYTAQVRTLERHGVIVAPSNAHAAELAAAAAR